MNQHLPVIATDAVGAAAGGLVRHERNGLVVRAGDPDALAAALRTLHDDPALRARLGANAARDVAAYTHRRVGRRLRRRPAQRDRPGDRLLALGRQPGREIATAPARCHRAMRRLLTAMTILCLAVPATAGAEGGVTKLLRDACGDEQINGTYTQAQYKKALDQLPTDSDEYTGCREVLQRGRLAALAAGKHKSSGGGGSTGAGTGGGAGSSGGGGSSGTSSPSSAPPADPLATATPRQKKALGAGGAVRQAGRGRRRARGAGCPRPRRAVGGPRRAHPAHRAHLPARRHRAGRRRLVALESCPHTPLRLIPAPSRGA